MPIRCRECEKTGLPHDEHCTPEELKALRQTGEAFAQIKNPELRRIIIEKVLAEQLWREAEASVRLDMDPRAETIDVGPVDLGGAYTRKPTKEPDVGQ